MSLGGGSVIVGVSEGTVVGEGVKVFVGAGDGVMDGVQVRNNVGETDGLGDGVGGVVVGVGGRVRVGNRVDEGIWVIVAVGVGVRVGREARLSETRTRSKPEQ